MVNVIQRLGVLHFANIGDGFKAKGIAAVEDRQLAELMNEQRARIRLLLAEVRRLRSREVESETEADDYPIVDLKPTTVWQGELVAKGTVEKLREDLRMSLRANVKLRSQRDKAVAVLRGYAVPRNWATTWEGEVYVGPGDGYENARDVLAELEKEET